MKIEEWLLKTSQIDILRYLNTKLHGGAKCVGEIFGRKRDNTWCANKGCYQCMCEVLKEELKNEK